MSRPDVSPIGGLIPLLKFEVNCIDEDDIAPNSAAWLTLNTGLRKDTEFAESTVEDRRRMASLDNGRKHSIIISL